MEQIRIGDELAIVDSFEEGCQLIRDDYNEELADLLLKMYYERVDNTEELDDLRDELQCVRDECEEEVYEAESKTEEIQTNIENVIDDILWKMNIPEEAKDRLEEALRDAMEV